LGLWLTQMRYDYIYRFWDLFGDGGFKELVNNGYNCTSTHYTYVPTFTAPGHTSIFTGTTPWMHGIIGNNWFERETNKPVYCAEDKTVTAVGGTPANGEFSPRRLLVNSIADEMKISNSFHSKVIGVAIKERSSILPAGRSADAAYWLDRATGKWITSTYYRTDLPAWVNNYNNLKRADELLSKKWELSFPIEKYSMCGPDDSKFEGLFKGEEKPIFPHDLPTIKSLMGDYELIPSTPMGDIMTAEFAIEAIKGENLGKGEFTDILTLSFSPPDYVGHRYGPQSVELADCYVKLDKDLKLLFDFLKSHFPKGDYVLFLSADHGVAEIPGFLRQNHIDCGLIDFSAYTKAANAALNNHFNAGTDSNFVINAQNYQFYFNYDLMKKYKTTSEEMVEIIKPELMKFTEIRDVVPSSSLDEASNSADPVRKKFFFGYHKKRGGDCWIDFVPAWLLGFGNTGTSHGSPFEYDSHVPLIFYGMGVNKGENNSAVEIIDIAPTIANYLKIMAPNGSFGKVIQGVFKK
jgi:Uncharacterized proteins of the AP superfamily